MGERNIEICGAQEHNLKNLDITIPRDKLVVITGLSGSGKSSLAFDTIYAEGQRRYVESLSTYARQFLGQMEKPDVESISGLSPAISIEQKTTSRNPRSTVGTVTEVYDYLRLLYARVGTPHCPRCQQEVSQQTVQEIADAVCNFAAGSKVQLLAPLVRGRKGAFKNTFETIRKEGYLRVRVDGQILHLEDDEIVLEKQKKHTIEVVIDRLLVRAGMRQRVTESLESGLQLGEGVVLALVEDSTGATTEQMFSEHYACVDCGISLPELAPRLFSFNSPFGACKSCDGLGKTRNVSPELLVPNPALSIAAGAIRPWQVKNTTYFKMIMSSVSKHYGFSLETPWQELSAEQQDAVLFGTGAKIQMSYEGIKDDGNYNYSASFEGVVNNLARRYKETASEAMRADIEKYMLAQDCPDCGGLRLGPESLAVTVCGEHIASFTSHSIKYLCDYLEQELFTGQKALIATPIMKEIRERLGFLRDVGLGYLTLDRQAGTLSGGEAQRIRLATQIGSRLMGVLYVLDEPSIGLHQRDNHKLIRTLLELRDIGNTVIVVEHDEDTIRQADHVIDMGPGAGIHGGQVVAAGTPAEIIANPNSLTGRFLAGLEQIKPPDGRRTKRAELRLCGLSCNNLKNIDVTFPLGTFIGITGVSGSGKSSLINGTIYPLLRRKLFGSHCAVGAYKEVSGLEELDKVIAIDQSPIGRTPRSNAATYTKVFTDIREAFTMVSEARIRGYKPGRFSFNVKGGRCEACQGDGIIKIEMHFLPDIYVPCEICAGKRYNRETLEIHYRGKTISDVLNMNVGTALEFFSDHPRISRRLQTLADVGLEYITLGQPATKLSGGEAQRIKLASELSRRSTGKTLYLLDEPTTGLHFADVRKLLEVLHRLCSDGNTIIVIEHNLDVIKSADYIVDLGPEGGDDGGQVVATGTPQEIAANKASHTGHYLKRIL